MISTLERSKTVPFSWTWQNMSERPPRIVTSSPRNVFSSFESITSDNSKSRSDKSCTHYKWGGSATPFEFRYLSYGNELRVRSCLHIDPRTFFPFSSLNFLHRVDFDDVISDSVPNLRNDFNIINFALELGDIPETFLSIGRSLVSPLGRLTLKGISDANLTVAMGVKPTYSDVSTLIDLFSNFGDKLGTSRAKLRQGITVRKRYNFPYSVEIPRAFADLSSNVFRGTLRVNGHVSVCVKCFVKGDIPDDDFRAFLDYIGFYPDASTIWNAIPFSFLVDYFLPIGEAFQKKAWLKPDVNISNACVSTKFNGTWEFICNPELSRNFRFSYLPNPLVTGFLSYYARSPVIPSLDGKIDLTPFKSPSLSQWINVASLAAMQGKGKN